MKKPSRYIGRAEVLDRVGVSSITLWEWGRQGLFPMSREVNGKTCFLEHEIDLWIEQRPRRQYKPVSESPPRHFKKKARG